MSFMPHTIRIGLSRRTSIFSHSEASRDEESMICFGKTMLPVRSPGVSIAFRY